MTCCKNGRNPGKPLSMPDVKSLKMSRYLMPKCAKSIQKLLVGPQSFLPVDPQLTGTSDSARLSHGEKKRRAKLSLCCYRLSRQTQRYLTILYSVIGTEMCCWQDVKFSNHWVRHQREARDQERQQTRQCAQLSFNIRGISLASCCRPLISTGRLSRPVRCKCSSLEEGIRLAIG